MKSSKKAGWLKRTFVRTLVWPESPFSIVSSSWAMARKSLLSTKANPEELAAFKNLSPVQRWKVAQEIHSWTNEQLTQERKNSCLLAYLFLLAACGVILGIIWSSKYLSLLSGAGFLLYAASFFLMFAKKSMRVNAIDCQQIILFDEWLNRPEIWLPTFNSKVFSDEKN
jgi:hypothetical protein